MKYPTQNDCKPGLWVELTNGWIVGPIVETEFAPSVYVKFSPASEDRRVGTWMLDVMGEDRVDKKSSRLVKKVGTREELTGRASP